MSELLVSHRPNPPGFALLDFHFASRRPAVSGVAGCAGPAAEESAGVWVPLTPLAGDRERWQVAQPATGGTIGPFEVRQTADLIALSVWHDVVPGRLASATLACYLYGLRAIRQSGYPHLLRVWNYLPDLNADSGAGDGYQQFCIGRADALHRLGLDPEGLPAASALGARPGAPAQITFLASRAPGRHLENPRQVSAHRYPSCYGPQPPSFARATLYGRRLLISGTAAIIGHESQHAGQVERQVRCTVDNLLMLMEHACAEADAQRVEDLHARVYLRHAEDLEGVRSALEADLSNLTSALYVQADVCRPELLVEIEASGTLHWRGRSSEN